MPPLSIPDFDGDFKNWESFRDIFIASVINKPNTSDVAKLRHLKSHVKGDALNLIQPFDITEHNFTLAWNKLKEKYEVKRRLVNAHIASIYSLNPMVKYSASEVKRILSGINTPLAALKGLKRPVQYWDDLLVFHVSSLLDIKAREQSEIYLSNSFNSNQSLSSVSDANSEPPSLDKLLQFLERQSSILESIEYTSSNLKQGIDNQNKFKNQNVSVVPAKPLHTKVETGNNKNNKSVNIKCVICSEAHLFQFCPKYKIKSIDQRKEFLDKSERCYNCLGLKHLAEKCFSKKRCIVCGGKHHTTLHINKNNNKSKNSNNQDSKNNVNNNQEKEVAGNNESTKTVSLVGNSS